MKIEEKFDVIKHETESSANASFIKGSKQLLDIINDVKDNRIELEIQLNGMVKFSEQLTTVGLDAVALTQGIGDVLKAVM